MSEKPKPLDSRRFGSNATVGTPVIPLEKVDMVYAEEFKVAKEQIKTIQTSLRELGHRIIEEKPDMIVFLDVSARILGTPYLKYLSEMMGNNAPLIRFYNDQDVKGKYLYNKSSDVLAHADFEQIKGKKVFFIDETFSVGKGAAALHEAAMQAHADAYYFALSRDPDTSLGLGEPGVYHTISEDTHEEKIKNLVENGKIVVYENHIKNLFSRLCSRLYVQDWQGQTFSVGHSFKNESNVNTIPDANSYYRPPEGMSIEEYETVVARKADALVRAVKEEIYQALKGRPDDQSSLVLKKHIL